MEDIPHPSDTVQPGDDEVSPGEKEMLSMLVSPSARLKFPLRMAEIRPGAVDWIYEIPDELKYSVLKKCWPFSKPSLGKRGKDWFDVHAQKTTKSERLNVIRWRGRNLVVSEFYEDTGGMAVDLMCGKNIPKPGDNIDTRIVLAAKEDGVVAVTGTFNMEHSDNG